MRWIVLMAVLLAGPAAAGPDLAAVSKACGEAALKKGLLVLEITSFEDLGGAVEATMTFRATRKRLVCTYDVSSRRTSLAEIARFLRPPPEAVTWQACEKAAKAEGFKLRKRLEQEEQPDVHGSPAARLTKLSVTRGGARWRVDCTYDFATEAVGLASRPD